MKKEQLQKPGFAFYRRIWQVAQPLHKHFLAVFALILLIQGVSSVQTWYVAKGIQHIMQIGIADVSPSYLLSLLAISVGAFIVRIAIGYARDQYERAYIDFSFSKLMTGISLRKYLSFSLGQHVAQHSSISQKIVNDGQSALQSTLQLVTYELAPMFGQLAVGLGVMFFVHPLLGTVGIGFTALYLFLGNQMNNWVVPGIEGQLVLAREHGKRASETYRNTLLITMESQQERSVDTVLESYGNFTAYAQALWKKFWDRILLFRFYHELFRSSMYVIAVAMIFRDMIPGSAFIMVYVWMGSIIQGIDMMTGTQRRLSVGIADIKKYFELVDTPPTIQDSPHAVTLRELAGEIRFEGVTFNYPQRKSADDREPDADEAGTDTAIKNVSFTIKPGQKVGIVGESGSGKTTVMNLIRRAFDPVEGTILIDGHRLQDIALRSYRRQIGNVDQNVQLFDMTIRENILFGLSDERRASITEAEIERVAAMACIDRFAHRLEHGLDTLIGEHGVKLSGGERQRVAIARALIKDPAIMIFDEATSSLDSKNERSIQDAIDEASSGRTTIIVAHRLSTVKNADKILVFDQGRIVGEGTHEELLDTCEAYAELVREQLVEIF